MVDESAAPKIDHWIKPPVIGNHTRHEVADQKQGTQSRGADDTAPRRAAFCSIQGRSEKEHGKYQGQVADFAPTDAERGRIKPQRQFQGCPYQPKPKNTGQAKAAASPAQRGQANQERTGESQIRRPQSKSARPRLRVQTESPE